MLLSRRRLSSALTVGALAVSTFALAGTTAPSASAAPGDSPLMIWTPDRVVAYGCDLLSLYAVSTAVEQVLYEGGFRVEVGAYLAALPADRFPNLVALAGAGEGERFEFGLTA